MQKNQNVQKVIGQGRNKGGGLISASRIQIELISGKEEKIKSLQNVLVAREGHCSVAQEMAFLIQGQELIAKRQLQSECRMIQIQKGMGLEYWKEVTMLYLLAMAEMMKD